MYLGDRESQNFVGWIITHLRKYLLAIDKLLR